MKSKILIPENPNRSIPDSVRVTSGILYAEAIRIALSNIEAAIQTMDALGYAVSARISYGRITSVGVVPKKD